MLNLRPPFQVLMTLLIHRIDFVLSRSSVVMEASMVRSLTNGGGKSTMTLGLCQYLARRRFITPIFLHAGFVHIALNMLAQLTASAEVSAVAQTSQIINCSYISDRKRDGVRWLFHLVFRCGYFWVKLINYLPTLLALTTFQQRPGRQLFPRGCALHRC